MGSESTGIFSLVCSRWYGFQRQPEKYVLPKYWDVQKGVGELSHCPNWEIDDSGSNSAVQLASHSDFKWPAKFVQYV